MDLFHTISIRRQPIVQSHIMRFLPTLLSVVVLGMLPGFTSASQDGFTFQDQETIALIGDGLIEQEQYFGWLELALTTSQPDKDLRFRNLGWNGDTPYGKSRFGLSLVQAGRAPADEGWKQLQAQINDIKPTIAILGYGMASSLEDGEDGLAKFESNYMQLLEVLKMANPKVRFIFLSPIPRADDAEEQKNSLAAYSKAIHSIAQKVDAPFIDLSSLATDGKLHKDPVHLNSNGYQQLAFEVTKQLQLPQSDWQESDVAATLRQVILRKNQWWFHRSRPANMAYVFGFRKHEQGQNAAEIPKFDPLIAEEETRIAALRDLEISDGEYEPAEIQKESQYAKFTPQATPEFTVADGFEVTLWADNPQLNKPIHMNFDSQGRLWIASSEAYPMIEVGQSAPDKIIVLEDTNGDGTADSSNVFADGLLIPTGVLPGDGGVYVTQSTDLLFLQDTNGDGKADLKRRVLSGFGTEDTHHNLHTPTWGYDGRLYMNQSVYTRTDAETPWDVVRLKAGGGFRLNTNNLQTEVFFRGLWNSWGHQFDNHGNSFLTDGAGFDGIAYTFPGAKFNPTPNAGRQLELISPGRWPKFCSMEIVSGDSFPPEWQGSIITCDFRANRVTRFSLSERGAGFVTEQQSDLLRTSATTFRPIDVKQGPDGALYIADWSNPIINHGEVDFRDERRDRWHGRIWRVSWKGAKKNSSQDLTKLENEELLANLLSTDRYTRDLSRRVLIERGEDAHAAFDTWANNLNNDEAKLQALWLCQAFNRCDSELLGQLLTSSNADVRSASVRVLASWSGSTADVDRPLDVDLTKTWLSKLVQDSHPRVRLEAIRACSVLSGPEAVGIALGSLEQELDPFIEYALWLTISEHDDAFLATLSDQAKIEELPPNQLEFFLTSIEGTKASELLKRYMANHDEALDGSGPWIELIGKAGDPSLLTLLFDRVTDSGLLDAATTERALDALRETSQRRRLRPDSAGRIVQFLNPNNDFNSAEIQIKALRLIGEWRLNQATSYIQPLIEADETPVDVKVNAIAALRDIRSPDANKALIDIQPQVWNQRMRTVWLGALAANDLQGNLPLIMETLASCDDETEARELWRAVLRTQDAGKTIAGKVGSVEFSEMVARAGLRVASEGRRDEVLYAALLPISGEAMTAAKLTPEKLAEYVELTLEQGDPQRGEELYRQTKMACITCHAIGGVGGAVGPDLSSIGASAPIDYLVESLFVPDAKIKEGFHSVVIITEDGQVITGVETSNDADQTVLRTATNEIVTIPNDEIVEKAAGNSLMPTGVVDQLTKRDQLDLIRFLSLLGKQGEFDASDSGVARVAEVLAGTHRLEQDGTATIINGELKRGWKPLYSRVNGSFANANIVDLTRQPVNIGLVHVYVRTTFDVETDREVTFRLVDAADVAVWIDGEAVDVTNADDETASELKARLKAGTHHLLIRLDAKSLPDALRIESKDVTFSTELITEAK